MSYYSDNIKRIAKQTENKGGIGVADLRLALPGSTKLMVDAPETVDNGGLVSPVTFTGLTYDDTQDVTITDDLGTPVLFKTLATAKLTDANGKEILIDEIIYEDPP